MIDKFIINFLASIDNFCSALAKMFESKPKKKPKKKGSVKTVIVNVIAKQSFIFIIMMVMFVFVMPVLVS